MLLETVGDTTAFKVVHGDLYGHAVTGKNLDIVHTHLSGDVSKNGMTIFKLNPKHGVGQGFYNLTLKLNYVVFSQRNPLPRVYSIKRLDILAHKTKPTQVGTQNEHTLPKGGVRSSLGRRLSPHTVIWT